MSTSGNFAQDDFFPGRNHGLILLLIVSEALHRALGIGSVLSVICYACLQKHIEILIMSYACSSPSKTASNPSVDAQAPTLQTPYTEGSALAARQDPRVERINRKIKEAEKELRQRLPWLRHQDVIGGSLFLIVLSGMCLSAYGYVLGWIPAWLVVVINGFLAAVAHEIEHDLIHRMYFKKSVWLQNVVLIVVWILRPNTINPLYRRKLHLYHHRVSGQIEDIEERLISNGMRMTPFRLLCMLDGFFGTISRHFSLRTSSLYSFNRLLLAASPMMHFYGIITYTLLIFYTSNGVAALLGTSISWSELLGLEVATIASTIEVFEIAFVVWILPNIIRSFSLNFISSNLHYYGDVKDIIQQCQIFNAWYLFPLNFFCCNFGSTHCMHHFVVGQTFYVRQLLAKQSHEILKAEGVRHNDMGTLWRANRFQKEMPSAS